MKVFPAIVLLILLCGFSFAASTPPGDVSHCLRITNPGTYTLTTDLVDGLITLGSGEAGCFWIDSSDVVLDCDGHSTTTTSYADSGIYASGVLDNITIKNCDIQNFSSAINARGNQSGNITNLKILDNRLNSTDYDLLVYYADHATVSGNTADPTLDFYNVHNSLISNNLVADTKSSGINLRGESSSPSSNNTLLNNTVLRAGKYGIYIEYAEGNYFINNTVAEGRGPGFYLGESSPGNIFTGNTARNNSLDNIRAAGFDIYSSDNVFLDNTAQNNSNGFYFAYGRNNLSGNHMFHNNIGLNLDVKSTNNTIAGNLIEENVYADLLVAGDPRMLYFDERGCSNTIENNTGSGGRPILYSEDPVNLVGGDYAEILLCGADGSSLNGVRVEGSDMFDNNALVLLFTDGALINNSQSNENAMGIWIYGSELVLINNSDTNGNALAGLFITLSRNVFVNQHLAHGNDGDFPNFFDDENPLIAAIPFGAGVLEINDLPGMGREVPERTSTIIVPFEITYYNDSLFYDNNYGLAFMFTPNATINNSVIRDNSYFGVMDASGSSPGMKIIDSELYRNGQDIFEFMQSTFSPEERASQAAPLLPEGVLYAEVVEAGYLISGMFDEPTLVPWKLESARHGFGVPSVLLSLDDMAEALYITSETQMPRWSELEYYDGQYNRTVFLNFTSPENLSSVNNKYFVILAMADGKNAIDNFSVQWAPGELSGYDPETLGLYYLNITDIIRPKSVEPVNITILADWVPVDGQVLADDNISVQTLRQPEAQFLRNFFPPIGEMNFYEGVYGLFAVALPEEDGGDQGGTERLSVSVDSECDGTTVTVTDSGGPVSGASVLVSDSQSLASLAIGSTDSGGEFEFDECDVTVRIYVNKAGYSPVTLSRTISCCAADGETEPEPEPQPEPEPKPEPQPEPEPKPEPEEEEPPTCPGECGSESYCDACPSGYTCVSYKCEKNDVSGEDGFVGDSKKVNVRIGNEPCPLCDIQVTAPDGKTFTGKTDENGEFTLPLSLEGSYKVALVDENGDVAAETTVNSLAKPTPSEEGKPTEEKSEDYSWIFLALLLAAAVVFIIYKARGQKG